MHKMKLVLGIGKIDEGNLFADADRRKNGRCSVQVEFINTS